MTKEGIYEFIARQKTSVLSSVGEGGNPGIDSASGEWL